MAEDLIELLLGIDPNDPVGLLRRQRPEALRHAEGAFRELLLPAEAGRLSHAERAALALRIAVAERSEPLVRTFRVLLDRAGGSTLAERAEAPEITGQDRFAALLRYADKAGLRPSEVSAADIATLSALGLGPREIVALTQLVSFVPYQVRLIAGLRAVQQTQAKR
jgi:uncharacterized protein YciW